MLARVAPRDAQEKAVFEAAGLDPKRISDGR